MTHDSAVTGHRGVCEPIRAQRAVPPVHARYELLDEIGSGSMGVVYRAFDRLSGQHVTLKRLRTQRDQAGRMRSSRPTDRVALAREFRLLATLRHPNVIGVLDYGFDEEGQPYFTMTLEEGGESIVAAARGRTLDEKVALLVQTLRGLAYVHRRGIVHRDIKPENILVVDGQVRLLDFGLSALREDLAPEGSLTGTFDYLAPEVLRGGAPTEQSDLFAVGIVAYEILAGRHPFAAHDLATSWANVLSGPLPLPDAGVDPRLEPVLARLLARNPEVRFSDASQVAAALGAAIGGQGAFETTASRESFLQQAAFVGRAFEIDVLGESLVASLSGRGSTWLIGGESGVGKTRLLEELRVLALVQGVTVARGQAPSVGGAPYHTWREPLRLLALNATSLDDRLVAALGAAVPDLASMLGRPPVVAEEIDDEAKQTRLLHGVQELLRRQRTPVAILLEDVQWAGSESVSLLAGLARVAPAERVIAVASYRREERPLLPDEIPGARSLQLGRLGAPAVRVLAESMIGADASAPDFVDYLCRETEGVPFFLVEVVRALADEAGGLAHVPHVGLPKLAVPGGIQHLLRRRLSRVGASELEVLRAAAVAGREIDERILRALAPELDDDAWLTTCAAVGILEAEEERFRFAHDKIREQLVADLGTDDAVDLHRRVALAIEAAHPDSDAHAAALAYQWREARDAVREAHHAARAGFHALESGAWREAIAFFERALEARRASGLGRDDVAAARRSIVRRLDPNSRVVPGSARFAEARLEAGIAEAWFRLGDLEACRRHGVRALRLGGLRVPGGPLQLGTAIVRQAIRRLLQSAARVGADDAAAEVARELVRVQTRLTESYFFSPEAGPLVWLALLMTNQCAPLGPSSELAKTYMVLGLLTGAVSLRRAADALCRRSVRMGEQSCSRAELAYLLTRVNNHRFGTCEWSTADAEIGRAAVIAEEVGDHRVWQEARSMQGMSALFQGRFADGVAAWRDAQLSAERSGNWQIECWALMGQADNLVRLGREGEAIPLYERALERFAGRARTTEEIWCSGMLALALLRSGDELGAERRADRALELVSGVTTVAYWTQFGTAATAEVFLALAARSVPRSPVRAKVERATRAMRRYARSFRLGRPFALLLRGRQHRIEGRAGAAERRWRAAAAWAERLGTPYELAGASLSLGLHARDPEQGARHLARAAQLYEAMGAARDLATVEAARREAAGAR